VLRSDVAAADAGSLGISNTGIRRRPSEEYASSILEVGNAVAASGKNKKDRSLKFINREARTQSHLGMVS
jgi:hypothetical protein